MNLRGSSCGVQPREDDRDADRTPGAILRVTYLELRTTPTPRFPPKCGASIVQESLRLAAYLALYRRVGEHLRWDQRIRMPQPELAARLDDGSLHVYVLRDGENQALGFCEFDRGGFPDVELKNFGLVPEVHGRGLGPWLLSVALGEQWRSGVTRIWLHTDSWDHPAALHVYEQAGFRVFAVRDEASGPL